MTLSQCTTSISHCLFCQAPFKPRIRRNTVGEPRLQAYCSPRCGYLSRRIPLETRLCAYCAKPFTVEWPKASHPQRHCSQTCAMFARQIPLPERFWACVNTSRGPRSCWPWTKKLSTYGYGLLMVRRRMRGAHIIAYELTHGPLLLSLSICHRCDIRPCCNPRHLFPGTPKDNAQDRWKKIRQGQPVPEPRGWKHRLTEPARQRLAERDNWHCRYCGHDIRHDAWTIDHVIPVWRGGATTDENLVLCCGPCNWRKSYHLLEDLGWQLLPLPGETPYAA